MRRLALLVLVVAASTIVATPSAGSAQQDGLAAAIHHGTCDAIGDVIATLGDAVVPDGERRGIQTAMPTASSFTTAPISLDAMIASDHAIVVPYSAGDQSIACGDIGGSLTDAGALIVGISPHGDTDVSGIAFLSPGADPTQTNISLFLSGADLEVILATTFLPLPVITEADAAQFAEDLDARADTASLAGPFAGTLVQQSGLRSVFGAGISTADFAATVTFTNPTEQTETPWDVGIAFHGIEETAQIVSVASDGLWHYTNSLTGMTQVNPSLTSFDASPGATNTLDLIVEGETARFGVNGDLVGTIALPPATASDVLVGAGWFSDHAVDGREIVYSNFEVWEIGGRESAPGTPPAASEDDASTFDAALAAREDSLSLGGPFGGTLHQRPGTLAAVPAGISTADFSASVTFVNPREQTETPWDYGLAFHQIPEPYGVQEIFVDSSGFWSYSDFPNDVEQSGVVPTFDTTPGATNTLDLIVDGTTVLFGVNGAFVTRLDLPSPIASDVLAATDFRAQNIVEGREIIYSMFQVWDPPTLETLAALPPAARTENDAARFAAALAARDSMKVFGGGPLEDTLVQQAESPTSVGAKLSTEDISATVAFTNPTEQTETPWDYGFGFHPVDNLAQSISVDSDGFWSYQGTRAGWIATFDGAPGATNTLDLIVDGDTALFGVNGAFVASIDLPAPTTFGIWVGTGFVPDHRVAGREIDFTLEVWI